MLDTQCSLDVGEHEIRSTGTVVKSADRALQVLEFFDRVRRPCSVSEVSRSLNCPQSSTSVLLRSLVATGYLHYETAKRVYFPSRRVSLLGSWVDPTMVQLGSTLQLVEEMAETLGQTVVVAVANGNYAQYIFVAGTQTTLSPGCLRPMAFTAVGRALLSKFNDDQIIGILRRTNADKTWGEPEISCKDLLTQVRQDQKSGVFSGGGADPDQCGLAIPLHRDGQMIVLGIEGHRSSIEHYRKNLEKLLYSPQQSSICK